MNVSKANPAQVKKALEYFDRLKIDVRVEPKPGTFPSVAPQAPKFTKHYVGAGMETYACTIHLLSVVFYTYCDVTTANGHEFEGHSGGLGVGELTAVGVIYYDDLKVLLNTSAFGVFFGAEEGGVVHVTWGANGNATAAGVGEGLGAFGGSGSWK
jgi:hypothetical protein